MKCKCGVKMKCIESRDRPDNTVRRRYECRTCGERYTSVECLYKDMQEYFNSVTPPIKKVAEPKPRLNVIKEPEQKKSYRVLSREEVVWRLRHPGEKYKGANNGVQGV